MSCADAWYIVLEKTAHSNPTVSLQAIGASFDPTEYVQRQRVTKAAPPKPAYNPLQFIQVKPCNLYQSAQDQLKRAEEVKKVKEVKKEDAEDWQCVSTVHAFVYNIALSQN